MAAPDSVDQHLTSARNRPLRSAVIVNPVRVDGVHRLRGQIESTLTQAGWPPPSWFETSAADQGTGQARQAVAQGAEVVFVCGGDGTVRSAVAGLVGTDTALAVLPAGTGNLLAMNLGLPIDHTEGVRMAIHGGRRRIDVGQVDGEVFAVMAGMGFDAVLMDEASTVLKAKIGPLAYVLSALKHLLDRPMRVDIAIDDAPALPRRVRTVLVANVGGLQGGIALFPDAEPDDGRLDVAIIAPHHLGHWARIAWGVLRRQRRVPRLEIHQCSRIAVHTDRDRPRQLDGDVIAPGRTLDVSVRPGALLVCCPAEPAPDGGP
jgi:YegS/Rv2252/BmrU family lipid kinase